jgi:hypothetical protein
MNRLIILKFIIQDSLMKKTGLCLAIMAAGLMIAGNTDAKIWRVNNNPGKSGTFGSMVIFADLTSALRSDLLQAGDTLHIEGSLMVYGKNGQTATNCDTVRKKLLIVGPGYLLGSNAETQHNKESARVRTLHVLPAAKGTVIAGLEQAAPESVAYYNGATSNFPYNLCTVYSIVINSSYANSVTNARNWGIEPACFKLRIEADNVTVSHCKLFYVDLYNKDRPLENITITGCMFNPGLITANAGVQSVKNLTITGNYFRNEWGSGGEGNYVLLASYAYCVIDLRGYLPTVTTAPVWGVTDQNWQDFWADKMSVKYPYPFPVLEPTIQNNTFYNAFSVIAKGARLYGNLFFPNGAQTYYYGLPQDPARPNVTQNNVIYNGKFWAGTPTAGLGYSTSYGGMLPNVNGNQYSNIAETSWFTASTAFPDLDRSFVLPPGSPARSGSDDSRQRGMFGGLSPYILSGLYTIPAVWEISSPAYPSGEAPATGLEVRVKAKSH